MALYDRIQAKRGAMGLTTGTPSSTVTAASPRPAASTPSTPSPRGAVSGSTQPQFGLPALGLIATGIGAVGSLFGGSKSPTVSSQEYRDLGIQGTQSPATQGFYDTLLGNRLRAIESLAGGQRQAALESLSARGLDRGTPLLRAYSQIGQGAQLAGQEAASGVQSLQYQERQAALDFQRQAYLTRLRADVSQDRTPWWATFFNTLGEAGGSALAFLKAGQNQGPGQPNQPASPGTAPIYDWIWNG